MSEFTSIAGQLGPYALFSVVMIWMVFKFLSDKKNNGASNTSVLDAIEDIKDDVSEMHEILRREDEDGVKLVYARNKSLEQAIVNLSHAAQSQTKLLEKILDKQERMALSLESLKVGK